MFKAFSKPLREGSRQVTNCFRIEIEEIRLDAAETGEFDIMAEERNAVSRELYVGFYRAATSLEYSPVSLDAVLGVVQRRSAVADPQDITVWRSTLHAGSIIEAADMRDRGIP